jgi:hypothetical protein
MTVEEIIDQVTDLGGMAIPAHVDRPSYSLLSNLGLIPPSLAVPALEVTPYFDPRKGFLEWPQLKEWCLIVNGDAHRLSEIQDRTLLKISHPEIKEMILAFQGREGRQAIVEWPNS